MRCILVTSEVGYIPNNYRNFTKLMSKNKNIVGLVVLQNNSLSVFVKGIGLMLLGAKRIGWQLAFNSVQAAFQNTSFKLGFNQFKNAREKDFENEGKWTIKIKDLNNWKSYPFLNQEISCCDLIVNARTRCIYKKDLLSTPKFGCVNIHHGILPKYRGTMCDFYAFMEKRIAGFTIHCMNEKIDDGKILKVVERPWKDMNYFEYLKESGEVEAESLSTLLNEVSQEQNLSIGIKNISSKKIHTKNPDIQTIKKAVKLGMKI